jgi:hypothetical protein
MKKLLYLLCIMLFASFCWADGTETLGNPGITIADGSGIAVGGVGLIQGQPAEIKVEVPNGAVVNQVLLYLEGTTFTLAEITPTMGITVNGADVIADLIGGPTALKSSWTATYRADISSLNAVTAGTNSVAVGGIDFSEDRDGAGILVIYDDNSEAAIDIRDGNDYVYIGSPSPLNVSVPQTFTFDKSSEDRVANVEFFVGSVAGGAGSGASCRPSVFEITTGGTTASFPDQLDSLDGLYWDTVSLSVTVPKGETQLTLEIFSRDDGDGRCAGFNPASMDWVAAGLSIETPAPDDCWITTGGYHNAGEQSGSKDFTFGGNVGPPPRGSLSCDVIQLTGPDQPGGKKGFKINQASFEGVGRLNFIDGYPFTGYVQDAGEPSGKKGNDQDYFAITVRDPITNAVVFEASATLDGGNVQIHPPTGNNK